MTLNTTIQERCPKVVLVAEKQPIARAALAELLSHDGYHAIQLNDLSAALAYTEFAENVVAVLVDLDMVEWRAIARQATAKKNVLVIAMRGVHLVTKNELDLRGVKTCFDKPITYGDIACAIKAHAPFVSEKANQSTALATVDASNSANLDRAKLWRRH